MKCPNCNQEMIEKKDFCINCGKRLIKEKQVSKKGIIVFMILMVMVRKNLFYLQYVAQFMNLIFLNIRMAS